MLTKKTAKTTKSATGTNQLISNANYNSNKEAPSNIMSNLTFNCIPCNKQFKTTVALKAHKTKMHKIQQASGLILDEANISALSTISTISIINKNDKETETIYDEPADDMCDDPMPISQCADHQFEQYIPEPCNNNSMPSLRAFTDRAFSDNSSEIMSELLFDIISDVVSDNKSEQMQIPTHNPNSEIVKICKAKDSIHCETCTCFKGSLNIPMVSSIRKSMLIENYDVKYEIPTEPIRDICLHGTSMLETTTTGTKICRQVQFKHYDSPIITTRIVKQQYPFKMRNLSFYAKSKQTPETYKYLNFKNGLTDYEATMKYTIENNIQYNSDTFNPTMISFDVEAFMPKLAKNVPINDESNIPTHKNGGVMSMICATFTKPNEVEQFKVYILDQYEYDYSEIINSIIERRTEAKIAQPNKFKFDIIPCENQTIMACAFLDDVKNSGISIMYGFNSSSTVQNDTYDEFGKIIERKSIGYDLPFIVHNSARYTQTELEYGSKIFGSIGKQIKKLSWLPNTYILDCQIIFQNDRFFALQLSDMPNRKLNSFLKIAEIPLKADDMTIYERMDLMRIPKSDQTSNISYCIWDAYALTLVLNKIQYIETVKANVSIFNIPLSWALQKNATNWITMFMLRRFYDAGFSFSYAKFPMPTIKSSFRGATTEACPIDLQMQVLINILMGDYESLYPNSIITANLGIDSITDENDPNAYKINLNFIDKYLIAAVNAKIAAYSTANTNAMTAIQLKQHKKNKVTDAELKMLSDSQNPVYAYFSKNPSLYATIVHEVLQNRLNIKTAMSQYQEDTPEYIQHDVRQNALKILVNTIYGLSGAKTFQLYDERVAAACTSIARLLTEIAREQTEILKLGQVVFRDTDSCAIMNVEPDIQQIKASFSDLNKCINTKLQSILGNTHEVRFIPEIKNYQVKTYNPPAKKSYSRMEKNLCTGAMILKIKGIPWSIMSEYGKQMFRMHSEYILMNLTTKEQIQNYITKAVDSIQDDMVQLTATRNYGVLAERYSKQIKNSQNSKAAQYLRKKFKISDSELLIMPIVKASKLKSECIVPSHLCKDHSIDINQLLDWFVSPFKKFYGTKEYDIEDFEYDEFEDRMEYRYATKIYGYAAKTKFCSYDKMERMLENKQCSFNEVLQAENKLFFDIDNAYNALNFTTCLNVIEKMICQFKSPQLSIDFAYTKTTSTIKPYSYHVVYQIKSTLAMNLFIALEVNKVIGFEICDIQLYSINKSLRLPNSPKPKKDENGSKILEPVYHVLVEGTIEQMYITNVATITNSLSNAIGFISKPHKALGYQNIELTAKYTIALNNYIKFEYKMGEFKEGSITINPIIKPYFCPVCSRQHESMSMVLYPRHDGFTLSCWAAKSNEKKNIKHKFEELTAITKKEARISELLRCTQSINNYQFKAISRQNIKFQHNSQVQYNLNAQATFVRSQMMTGKTKQQIELITDAYPTILALSFRRTFARDNASKNQFVNYEDISGDLNLHDYPRLLVQVDSLARVNTSVRPSLLIIDELESTIEQLISIKRDTTPYVLFKFIQLLQSAEKVLCLDAELEESSIQVITQLIGTDNYKVFVNTFQPKTESNIVLHDYVSNNASNREQIIKQVVDLVQADKKIVVFSTSCELAKSIQERIPEGKSIKYYDGNDAGKINGKSKALIKSEDFADVNTAWANCDVLIYTGTLTAGISFELQHFDSFIGVFCKQTASALAFTQGLHRVRNFKDKIGHLYLEKETNYLPQTSFQITQNQSAIYGHSDVSEVSQLSNWIQASMNQSKNNNVPLIIRNLSNMGYKFTIEGTQDKGAANLKSKRKIKYFEDMSECQITLDDLTRIPKILKSNTALMADTDLYLEHKYDKIKIFKSFFPVQNQESLDKINGFESNILEILFAHRPRIANGNKLKNIIQKCLNERPELMKLEISQMNEMIKACNIDSKQHVKAQKSETVQKDSVNKFYEQIYVIKQALIAKSHITDLEPETLEKALAAVKDDKTLKNLGYTFTGNGVNKKLNTLLNQIDLDIVVKSSKRVQIKGKEVRQNTYRLELKSAENLLQAIKSHDIPTLGITVQFMDPRLFHVLKVSELNAPKV